MENGQMQTTKTAAHQMARQSIQIEIMIGIQRFPGQRRSFHVDQRREIDSVLKTIDPVINLIFSRVNMR